MRRLLGLWMLGIILTAIPAFSQPADDNGGIYYDSQAHCWRNKTIAAAPAAAPQPAATPVAAATPSGGPTIVVQPGGVVNIYNGVPANQETPAPPETRGSTTSPEDPSNVVFRPAVYTLTPAPGDYEHNVYTQMFGDPRPFYGTPDPFPYWNGGGYDPVDAYLQGISYGYGLPYYPSFGGGFPTHHHHHNNFNGFAPGGVVTQNFAAPTRPSVPRLPQGSFADPSRHNNVVASRPTHIGPVLTGSPFGQTVAPPRHASPPPQMHFSMPPAPRMTMSTAHTTSSHDTH